MSHAVSRLRAACLADNDAVPRLDRGEARVTRCAGCRLPPAHCLCASRPEVPTRAAFCLLMAPFEALKPSNTGWLVADVVPDTWAFTWSRTAVEPALRALLADPRWDPCVVFPGEFAEPARVVDAWPPAPSSTGGAPPGRRPLFVLLDGTWSEARKMFRKSPDLAALPVLSLRPEERSRYRLRRSWHAHHFCTAEVAALCVAQAGELPAAQALGAWLDVFSERYLRARQSLPPAPDDDAALRALAPVTA